MVATFGLSDAVSLANKEYKLDLNWKASSSLSSPIFPTTVIESTPIGLGRGDFEIVSPFRSNS